MNTFTYETLDMERIEASLSENGFVLVRLPPEHASACIQFIESVRGTEQWRRVPLLRRPALVLKAWRLTKEIERHNPRLSELWSVIIHWPFSSSWTQQSDGQYMFKFTK